MKIQSEIRNKDGSYTKEAMEFSNSFKKVLEKFMKSNKSKLSWDSKSKIMQEEVFCNITFKIALQACE